MKLRPLPSLCLLALALALAGCADYARPASELWPDAPREPAPIGPRSESGLFPAPIDYTEDFRPAPVVAP